MTYLRNKRNLSWEDKDCPFTSRLVIGNIYLTYSRLDMDLQGGKAATRSPPRFDGNSRSIEYRSMLK